MDEFTKEYKFETLDEVNDNLNQLLNVLEDIERHGEFHEHINELFRLLHSIKGNARSADFNDLSDSAHRLENLLLKLKEKEIDYQEGILTTLFKGHETYADFIQSARNDLAIVYDFDAINKLIDHCSVPDSAEGHLEISANVSSPAVQKSKLQILLVDDEPGILELLECEIKDEFECDIFQAKDGAEALSIANSKFFDVIMTDYNMPHMNGGEFIFSVRHQSVTNRETPIIMLTGIKPHLAPNQQTWENVFFLEKPVDAEKIYFIIKCALRLRVAA